MFPRPIPRPLPLAATWALRIAAFPRPAPEPWFLFFMLFNIGAFFSMSGKIRKRILLPRMYTCSSCATRPSLYVTVMLDIWQFMLSSASMSFPRYTSPVFVSHVTMWPSASCSTLIGTPIDILAGRELGSGLLFLLFGARQKPLRRRRESREWRAQLPEFHSFPKCCAQGPPPSFPQW